MKVVYLTNGMASTLNSCFELCRRLAEGQHSVHIMSPADIGDQVVAQGFAFTGLQADRAWTEAAAAHPVSWRQLRRPLRWWQSARERRRIHRASIVNDEIESRVAALAPDVLLIDIEMHFATLTTARLGIPTLLPIFWFTIFRHPGLPPMHTALPPSQGLRGRLRTALSWRKLRLSTLHMEWRQRLARWRAGTLFEPVPYDSVRVDQLRAVARSRGISLRRAADRRQWLRPYVPRNLPVLCYNVREMELPHEPHPQMHYLGPMIHRARREALADASWDLAWHQFSEQRGERSLVYCSLGTYWAADQAFLKRILSVFARRPDWCLVLGLGGNLEPSALEPLPPNALVVAYAPQLVVLEQAQCAVTHGGITSINECVRLGVPMVVYSTGFVDQDGCAVRVDVHGLGVVANKDLDDSPAIERNIERVLTDPTLRAKVESMRDCFVRYEQEDAAVRLIERAAAQPPDAERLADNEA